MFQATSHYEPETHHSTVLPPPSRRTRRAKAKSKAKREVNYRSANRKGTDAKQALIRELLATGLPFTVRAIGTALGISRQLALYHVKKMAATGQLVMMLEPCERNGGLQFRVWSQDALMSHYVTRFYQGRAA